jgi:heat-inducible transcriptional repressor
MHDCSVVLATANAGGGKAILGLIGPVRMNYESSIAVLETVLEGLRDDDGSEEEQRHVY